MGISRVPSAATLPPLAPFGRYVSHTHTHTHTHTRAHTHIHTHTHAHIHAHETRRKEEDRESASFVCVYEPQSLKRMKAIP
jgi:hypothetical protein